MPATNPHPPYPVGRYTVVHYGTSYGHTVELDGKVVAQFEYAEDQGDTIWFSWNHKTFLYPSVQDAIHALSPLEAT